MTHFRDDIDLFIRRAMFYTQPTCYYCGAVSTTIDHLHPVLYMGTNHLFNLVTACKSCNQSKGSLLLKDDDFLIATEYSTSKEQEVRDYAKSARCKKVAWSVYTTSSREKESLLVWWKVCSAKAPTQRFEYKRG